MRKLYVVVAILLLFTIGNAYAQEPPHLVQVDNLRDSLTDDGDEKIAISLDGDKIIQAQVNQICILTVSTGESWCTGYPSGFSNVVDGIAFSPDTTRFAFVEPVMNYFVDSDIWMVDLTAQDFADLTDDGLHGNFFSEPAYQVDVNPVWLATGELYFIRYEKTAADADTTTALYHFPANSTTPELVYDFGTQFDYLNISRGMSFSPDGTELAFTVAPPDFQENPVSGVWVLNLETQALDQVAGTADFVLGLPTWATLDMQPDAVYWAGDNLVAWLFNYEFFDPITHHAIYIDRTTGTVTPLADYSDVPDKDALLARTANGEIPSIRIPRSGVVVKDAFIYLGFFDEPTDFASIRMIPLPPDGSPSVEIGQITDFEPRFDDRTVAVSPSGAVYMRGYRLVFE